MYENEKIAFKRRVALTVYQEMFKNFMTNGTEITCLKADFTCGQIYFETRNCGNRFTTPVIKSEETINYVSDIVVNGRCQEYLEEDKIDIVLQPAVCYDFEVIYIPKDSKLKGVAITVVCRIEE